MRTAAAIAAVLAATAVAQDAHTRMTITGMDVWQGSAAGGTRITITGSGFDLDGQEGSVAAFLGASEMQCESYYQTARQLVCYTPPSPGFATQYQTLTVTGITVDRGIQAECLMNNNCRFQYWDHPRVTPFLHEISYGGKAGDVMQYTGYLENSNYEEHSAKIGGFNCELTEELNPDAGRIHSSDWHVGMAQCFVPEGVAPGRHNFTLHTTGVTSDGRGGGAAWPTERAKQVDARTGEVWQFTSHPHIASLDFAVGSTEGGSLITITGSNFDPDAEDNTVELAGRSCAVESVSADGTRLTCRTSSFMFDTPADRNLTDDEIAQAEQGTIAVPAQRGWIRREFENANNWNPIYLRSSSVETGAIQIQTATHQLNSDSVDWAGFFVAPYTGTYVFKVTRVDDDAYFDLSDDESPDGLQRIVTAPSVTTDEFRDSRMRSSPIHMVAGERRYARALFVEHGGNEYLNLGVEIVPDDFEVHPTAMALRGVDEVQDLNLITTVVREVHRVTVSGVASGKWRLRLTASDGQEYNSGLLSHTASTTDVYNAYRGVRDADNNHPVGCTSIGVGRTTITKEVDGEDVFDGYHWDITLHCPSRNRRRPVRPVSAGGTDFLRAPAGSSYVLEPSTAGSLDGIIQDASEPLDGFFHLQYGNQSTGLLSYGASNWDVEMAIQALDGVSDVVVSRSGNTFDGARWRVSFVRPWGTNFLPLRMNLTRLTAGNERRFTNTTLRDGAAGVDLTPLPADLLETALPVPPQFRSGTAYTSFGSEAVAAVGAREHVGPVKVTSNGVRASCDTYMFGINATGHSLPGKSRACSFAYSEAATPVVTAVSSTTAEEGDELTITGEGFLAFDPSSLPTTTECGDSESEDGSCDDTTYFTNVRIGSAACAVTAASATSITCTMGHGSAGDFDIEVEVGRGIGKAARASGLAQITYTSRVDSVSPSSGSSSEGGAIVTIAGTGFFLLDSESDSNTVSIGGNDCAIVSASASSIVCVAPAAGSGSENATVDVVVNNVTMAGAFGYDSTVVADVTAISPTTLSSAITGTITLTVSNLPDGLTAAGVEVSFGSRSCRVTSVSASEIACELLRAEPLAPPQAALSPLVYFDNTGYAAVSGGVELDTGFRMESVSPSSGSWAGGTELTISGAGFSTSLDGNLVQFFANVTDDNLFMSVPCEVTAATATQITCTTADAITRLPPGITTDMLIDELQGGRWEVRVNRISATWACGGGGSAGTCDYAFDRSRTPQISSASYDAESNLLTVDGAGFLGSGGTTIRVGSKDCPVSDDSEAVSQGRVVCEVADDRAGTVAVQAHVSGYGLANVTNPTAPPQHTHVLTIDSISPVEGSSEGGQLVTIHGYGFDAGDSADSLNAVDFMGSELGSSATKRASVDASTATHRSLTITTPGFRNAPGIVRASVRLQVLATDGSSVVATDSLADAHATDVSNTTLTPHLDAISPTSGEKDTVVTIEGSGFGASQGESHVSIGDADCSVSSWSDSEIQCTVGDAYGGSHAPLVTVRGKGLAWNSDPSFNVFEAAHAATSISGTSTSFGGGAIVSISGKGFPTISEEDASSAYAARDAAIAEGSDSEAPVAGLPKVGVCDTLCEVVSSSYSTLQCRTAPLVNSEALTAFNAETPRVFTVGGSHPDAELIQSQMSQAGNAFDGDAASTATSGSSSCHVGMDFGEGREAVLTRFAWYPDFWRIADTRGAVVEGSNDGTTWTTLVTVDLQAILEGWNHIDLINGPEGRQTNDLGSEDAYRYLRYRAPSGRCRVNELEFEGVARSTVSSGQCDVTVTLPAGTAGAAEEVDTSALDTVDYSADATPTYTDISPVYGTALGGTNITIAGTNFGSSVTTGDVTVELNGVPCEVVSASDTEIVCTTGARDRIREPTVEVTVDGRGTAMGNSTVYFRYLDRWSQRTTWAGSEPPVEGDTVIIPEGQAVLLDVSPPRLFLILVQGELVFDRQDGLHLQATYIWVHGGHFQIGEEDAPYMNQATVTLHGDRWRDIELPGIGAKTLSVSDRATRNEIVPHRQRAILEVHGEPRKRSWTRLGATSEVGSDVIELQEPVDWRVGDKLFVTSSTRSYQQQEDVEVAEVLSPTRLRLTQALRYRHRYQIFDGSPYGHTDADLSAAVGLETRNVVIQGSGTQITYSRQLFGGHTMAMNGGIYRLENLEVRRAGQGGILGRYPTHTHMAGAQAKHHYVKSFAVHDSNQRCATIHGSKYYTVFSLACTRARGHNVFVEDGAEEWNLIDENLVARTVRLFNALKGDMKPASFWAASPKQIWRNNMAAGCINDGYWHELPGNPHGPSFTTSICPVHDHLGQFHNNTAQANGVQGLRIYPVYLPLKNPCNGAEGPPDQYQTYTNLTSFRNGAHGIFNKEGGAIRLMHFKLMGNGADDERRVKLKEVYGPPLHQPNSEGNLYVRNPDEPTTPRSEGKVGLFAPQDEYYYGKDLTFVGYGDGGAIAGCAKCASQTDMKQGGYTFRLSGLRFFNSTKRVRFTAPYKQIFQDDDGSLTGTAGGWATAYRAFNVWPGQCERQGVEYDSGIVCDNTVKVRRLQVDQYTPRELDDQSLAMTVRRGTSEEAWDIQQFLPKEIYGWVSPVVSGKLYDASMRRWDNDRPYGVDFNWLRMRYSDPAYVTDDDNEWLMWSLNRTYYAHRYEVRMMFNENHQTVDPDSSGYLQQDRTKSNYAQHRSLYWERPPIGNWSGNPFGEERRPLPTDDMGTGWYNQSSNRWYVVMNNRNVTASTPTHNDAHGPWNPHRYTKHRFDAKVMQCPPEGCRAPGVIDIQETLLWSEYFPSDEYTTRSDLLVPNTVKLVYDLTDSPAYRTVRVEGIVEFRNDGTSRRLQCEHLLIFGRVTIGTEAVPWRGANAEIKLFSQRGEIDDGAVVDNDIYLDDKVIFVGGELLMFGTKRDVTWAKLAQTASADATSITLDRDTDIRVGDRITVAPTEYPGSGSNPEQLETVTVSAVANSGRQITFSPALEHRHFAGTVDLGRGRSVRLAAAVGVLSRNVRITSNMEATPEGGEPDTFGGHMVVSEMYGAADELSGLRAKFQGRIHLSYVELQQQGQGEMEHSALFLQFSEWRTDSPNNPVQRIIGCAFSDLFNYGVVGFGARNIEAKHNVFHHAVRTAFELDSRAVNATVEDNLVAGVFRSADETNRWARNRAGFFLDVEPRSLQRNVVGGSYDGGFTIRPTRCSTPWATAAEDPIRDNEAYGSKLGFFVLSTAGGGENKCVQLQRATVWKAAHIGIVTVDQLAHFRVDQVTVTDSHIGFSPNYFRRGSLSYTVVQNSNFAGSTAASTCSASVSCLAVSQNDGWGTTCASVLGTDYRRAGIMSAQYTNRGKTCTHDGEMPVCRPVNTPTRMCSMPWEKRYGLPSTRHAEYHVIDTNFAHFGNESESCGGRQYESRAVVTNPTQVDFFPPMFFRGINWFGTGHANKFSFAKNGQTEGKCRSEACDGFNVAKVEDIDGTTVSTGRANSVILSGWDIGNADEYPVCQGVAAWTGVECAAEAPAVDGARGGGLNMVHAVFDGLDRDRGFRLIGPVRIQRVTPTGSLRNASSVNPIADHCAKRFPFQHHSMLLEPGVENHVRFGGTLPGTLRGRFHSSDANEAVVVKMFIQRPNSIDVFYNGQLVQPLPGTDLPTLASPAGANKFDPQGRHLYFTMRGGNPGADYLIRRRSSVQLNMTLAVSVDEFAGENVVQNLAILLSIPADRIKVVDVAAGSAHVGIEIQDEAEPSLEQSATVQQVSRLVAVGKTIKAAIANNQLDVGYPLEDAEIGISRPALEEPPSDEAMTSERGTVLPPSDPEVDALLLDMMASDFLDLSTPGVPFFAGENITYNNVTIQGYVDTNVDDVSAIVGRTVPRAPGSNTNETEPVVEPPADDGNGLGTGLIAGVVVGSLVVVGIVIVALYFVYGRHGAPASTSDEVKLQNSKGKKIQSSPLQQGAGGGRQNGVEWHGANPTWQERARVMAGSHAGGVGDGSSPGFGGQGEGSGSLGGQRTTVRVAPRPTKVRGGAQV